MELPNKNQALEQIRADLPVDMSKPLDVAENVTICPLKSVENPIVTGIRYLHEQKKMTWEEIGKILGYSKTRVIEIRWSKKMPKEAWQKKILDKLNKVLDGIRKPNN